jgi:MerR family transcriptional regulator, heat shock protein HspR
MKKTSYIFGIKLVFINTGMSTQEKDILMLNIGAAAEKLGISAEAIRMYERKGLIITKKTPGNQRLFSQSDIERLECIRTAINGHKISIEGIRRIQSLVPCWEHIHCDEDKRKKCPAYHRPNAGCWTYRHQHNECSNLDCYECSVYRLSGDCENIKSLIYDKVKS